MDLVETRERKWLHLVRSGLVTGKRKILRHPPIIIIVTIFAVLSTNVFYRPFSVGGFFLEPTTFPESEEFCPVNKYSAAELDHVLNQNILVDLKGLDWSISPYSFHLPNTQPSKHLGTGLKNQRNIVIVLIESFAPKHLAKRLPGTWKYLSPDNSSRETLEHIFTVKRVGINSIPNRGALLLGHSYPDFFRRKGLKNEKQKVSVSLVDKAKVAGMDVFISETVEKPCQHYSNTLSVLNTGCLEFQEAYAKTFKGAGCVLQDMFSAGNKCPRFPYPSTNLPTNCSNVGMHHVIAAQLRRALHDSKGVLAILNFLDFHPPKAEYTSPDLDAALVNVVSSLRQPGKPPFTLYILGDHGHGFLSDGGDAVGVLYSSRDRIGEEALLKLHQPILSMLTLNRVISSQILDSSLEIPNSCLSEGIPEEYCRTCFEDSPVESADSGETWLFSFSGTNPDVLSASTRRILTCEHLMDHDVIKGAEINVFHNVSSCSADFSFHFLLSDRILFKAVTSYKKFQECTSHTKPLIMRIVRSGDESFDLQVDLTSDPPALVKDRNIFDAVHEMVNHVVDIVG